MNEKGDALEAFFFGGGITNHVRHMGTCRSSGSVFHEKPIAKGLDLVKKSLEGPIFLKLKGKNTL